MPLFDNIYIYAYALALRTPSRDNARSAASFAVAIVLIEHLLGVLLLLSGFSHQNLISYFGKPGLIVPPLLIVGGVALHFRSGGHAERILKTAGSKVRSSRAAWIGLAIFLWSLSIPFVCAGVLIALRRTHVL